MEIKKIITDMPMEEATHWFETTEGVKLFIPYHWGTKLNLNDMTYVSRFDEDYDLCSFPTLQKLINSGQLKDKPFFPYKIFELNLRTTKNYYMPRYRDYPKECDVKSICKRLEKHGFHVTEEAVQHNFWAWICGGKSGYRDEKNGYHLFTPCGLNPLSFRVTSLHPACEDWQITYVG